MKIIKTTLFLIVILFPGKINAQSFSFKHYTVEDGLNTSTVYYATQDLKGYMWFATEQGVCKFDGKTFTRYTINDGLSDNEVLFIKTDRKGRIWFLTLNGHLSFYYNRKFHNESNTQWLKKTFVGGSYNSCFEDSQGRIFLGSFSYSLTVIKDDSVINILPIDSLPYGASFFENSDRTVNIYLTNGGGYVYKGDKLFPLKLGYSYNHRANCISYANRYQFYISDGNIIKNLANTEEILIQEKEMFPRGAISSVIEKADSSILITSRNGVLWFPKNTFKKNKALKILAGKRVLSHFDDNENNFWFCTEGDGVYMLPNNQKKVLTYTTADGLHNEVINRVIKDSHENIWLACDNSVVSEITNKGVTNFLLKDAALKNGRVRDIAIDKFNNIFAATDQGIIQLDRSSKQRYMGLWWGDKMGSSTPKSVNTNVDNSITATISNGIIKLEYDNKNQAKFLVPLFKPEYNSVRTYSHFMDRQKRLWVSDIHGLGLYKHNQLNYFYDKDSLLKNRIVNMGEMPDSTLVLSTEGYGVIFFKNGKIINHFTELNGLSSNVCRRIFIKGDTLWVSTYQGLTMLRYHNNTFSDIHIFNTNNGLLSNAIKDVYDDGKTVYVATEKGLCLIEDRYSEIHSSAPPVNIIEIICNGRSYTLIDSIYRFSQKDPVKIDFSAVTFQNPSELRYRYRISKISPNWIETKNNSVEYSSFGSGKYIFELQAKKVNSDWSKSVSASFIIVPPFYKTIWFFLVTGGLIIFLLFWIIRYFIQRKFKKQLVIIRQNQMLELERMRIASDMHDDIGADLTQISMWTNILKTSEKNNPEVISKIVYSTNDVLQKMDQIIWALDSVHDKASDFVSYLKECIIRSLDSTGIKFTLQTNESIPDVKLSSIQRRNIFLVMKELLHNTIKHSRATEIKIKIIFDPSNINIAYSDNGRGFDSASGDGLGFTTMKQRMADINGNFNFHSAKEEGFSADLFVNLD